MIKCKECNKEFKFLTERHLNKHNLTTKQYLEKWPEAKIYSREWNDSVKGKNNPRYIDGRSTKRRLKLYKCSECGSRITGRGKSNLCVPCQNIRTSGKSKLEEEIILELKNIFYDIVEHKHLKDNIRNFYPDILLFNNTIVEVYGDYWHCNPEKWNENDIGPRGHLAKDIWEKDFNRQQGLENLGYRFEIIWEKDWKENKDFILQKINNLYNWEM